MVPTKGWLGVNPASDALAATIGMGVLMVYGGFTVLCRRDGRRRDHRHIRKVPGELRDLLILVALPVEQSISAAQHQFPRSLVRKAGARAEVIVVAIHNRAAVAVFAGQRELPVLEC